jgi:glucose-6-phosphate isomerase
MEKKEIAHAFSVFFSLADGLSSERKSLKRYLSDIRHIFSQKEEAEKIAAFQNPLVYEFYELGMPEDSGDLAFGTSIVYPGKIGREYFMTKGHFHRLLDTAEVYYCLNGHGAMLMENPEGAWDLKELTPGKAVYVPKRFAHRSINTGDRALITFFCFRADAGHDYKTIEDKGFRKIVLEKDGKPEIQDNPRWQ